MVDVDKLAGIFASGFCQIERVYRLVIQPHSLLRDFRTWIRLAAEQFMALAGQ